MLVPLAAAGIAPGPADVASSGDGPAAGRLAEAQQILDAVRAMPQNPTLRDALALRATLTGVAAPGLAETALRAPALAQAALA
ncbi:MAG TPA: hypothetical protein VHH36_07635, partial [Candidatus Thermoplasmatota archaeon]|nr:hypothetical protein [Candidatus Thermoplasmatota archaeon]